jgi:hypothetical protein
MQIAASLALFVLALGASWISAFWALRWSAYALAKGRPSPARARRALLAGLALLGALGAAVGGFLGISALGYIAAQ